MKDEEDKFLLREAPDTKDFDPTYRMDGSALLQECDDSYMIRINLMDKKPREVGLNIQLDTLTIFTKLNIEQQSSTAEQSSAPSDVVAKHQGTDSVDFSLAPVNHNLHSRIVEARDMHIQERDPTKNPGPLHYSLPLPSDADTNNVKCAYVEGVLIVTIYKSRGRYLELYCD